jgi:RimJ/RimL family protein N-acetyltransferase
LNEIDLGYRFKKESWGKGFATEAAFASLEYGFSKLGLKRIMGRALPENTCIHQRFGKMWNAIPGRRSY